ncbi:hypothetical protein [Roseococcus sp. YIM B11640]|uniref:hypothetical protein n=1 Tax=Roseococcus sp. YIM B11640 TaxID=3133973 RepID=UPI003C7A7D61
MRVKASGFRLVLLLGIGSVLAGCSSFESGFASMTGGLSGVATRYGPSWGGMRPAAPADSLTVQRIQSRSSPAEFQPLRPEPGDVWPQEEAPRATLANPDEALRGVSPSADAPPPRRRGSAAALEPTYPSSTSSMPVSQRAVRTTAPRTPAPAMDMGQVISTPQGPVTTTGGTNRVQTTISPQGSGLAIQEGAVTTIIGPGGNVQQVPTPR